MTEHEILKRLTDRTAVPGSVQSGETAPRLVALSPAEKLRLSPYQRVLLKKDLLVEGLRAGDVGPIVGTKAIDCDE